MFHHQEPDVIQFQEVSLQVQDKIKPIKSLYPYTIGLNTPVAIEPYVKPSRIRDYIDSIMEQDNKVNIIPNTKKMRVGNIIVSKYPLKNPKIINNNLVLANIILDDTELTLIGTHLYPPESQYYFKLTIDQMEYLINFLKKTNQSIILFGDLNMAPTSKRFINFLNDTKNYIRF